MHSCASRRMRALVLPCLGLVACGPGHADGLNAGPPWVTDEPHAVLPSGFVLDHASATGVDGFRIVAGMLRNARRGHANQELTPWTFHQTAGLLSPPFPRERAARIEAMAPVPVEAGWALMWGEAVAPAGWSGPFPPYIATELWMAMWRNDGWEPPLRLLTAPSLQWARERSLRARPGSVTFLMLPAAGESTGFGPGPVYFGEAGKPLSPIQASGIDRPLTASFDVGPAMDIVAVFMVPVGGPGHAVRLYGAISQDGGASWGSAQHGPEFPVGRFLPGRLSAHLDATGSLHVFWADESRTEGASTLHVEWQPALAKWIVHPSPFPVSGQVGWVSGRVGDHVMISAQVMDSDSGPWRALYRQWGPSGWSAPVEVAPGWLTTELFGGIDDRGEGLLGWNGMEAPVGPMEGPAQPVTVWVR